MPSSEAFFLDSPFGNRVLDLNGIESVDCALATSAIGALALTLPYNEAWWNLFVPDSIVEFWRGVSGGQTALFGNTLWFLNKRRRYYDDRGAAHIDIGAVSAVDMLRRRIVAYAAATSQAWKIAASDDMSKAIVRENLGSLAASSRQIVSYFLVQADVTAAPVIEKRFSWRNVLTVLQEIVASSYQNGTYLAFDITCTRAPTIPSVPLVLEFRTYVNQRGTDRRASSGRLAGVVIGSEFGTVLNGDYEEDWSPESNFAWAAGQGVESARIVESSGNSARISSSPWALTEIFVNASQQTSPAGVQAEADSAVWRNRARKIFKATQIESSSVQIGRDVDWGDFVTVQHFGQNFDCRLDSLRLRRTLTGGERLQVALRSDA